VLRDPASFEAFHRAVEAVPLSRAEWQQAHAQPAGPDRVADAVAFFADCWQSRDGLRKTSTPPTRNCSRRGMNGNTSEWLSAVDGLPEVHARLRRVVVECLPAVGLTRREGGAGTRFSCDAPYPHPTRAGADAYACAMTGAEHRAPLDAPRACPGQVLLPGCPSALYRGAQAGWSRHTFDLPNNAAGGKVKGRETEVVWCNF
jgi:DNA adenine methylase